MCGKKDNWSILSNQVNEEGDASHETDVKKIWIAKHSIKSTIHLPLFVAKNDKEHDKAVSIWKGDKKSKHMDIYSKKGSGYKR